MRLLRPSQPEVSNRGARRFCHWAGVTNCETASIRLNTNGLRKEVSRLWERGRALRNTDVKCFVLFVLTLFLRATTSQSWRYIRLFRFFLLNEIPADCFLFDATANREQCSEVLPRFKKRSQPDSLNPHSVCNRRLALTEKIGRERRSCGYDCAIN